MIELTVEYDRRLKLILTNCFGKYASEISREPQLIFTDGSQIYDVQYVRYIYFLPCEVTIGTSRAS